MEQNQIFDLISKAKKILIVSHFHPDPDSIGSSLFTYNLLSKNYTEKEITIAVEGSIPYLYSFLKNFDKIHQVPDMTNYVKEFQPDLLIMLDGSNVSRITKFDNSYLLNLVESKSIRSITIDHHRPELKNNFDIYFNTLRSSTCEEVYLLFKDKFECDIEDKKAILFGILDDTGRFMYKNNHLEDTFKIAADFVKDGLNIEELYLNNNTLNSSSLLVIKELMDNFSQTNKFNYSYIKDSFVEDYINKNLDPGDYNIGYHFFIQNFLRTVAPNKWGFIIIPDVGLPKGNYQGSFRALNGIIDLAIFAKELNGGGHKPAAGFRLKAESVEIALEKVKDIITNKYAEAVNNR